MPANVFTSQAHPVTVERRPYKGMFIEVEVYERRDIVGFYAWPYIGREGPNSMVKQHFVLKEESFSTRQAAIDAAIKDGQARIDAGFDPG